ncbi:hypothetical protein I2486_01040 [Cellulophaga sp. E16_2]|uniref:Transmembrane protein n=1 Tax=Cellulophaga algicola (strain DSM 14237 / IC166 / ACAM 630) TaxID=688270 RepID=E6X8N1_CELAD|nr:MULTISPECIES: hypothetical protein [Cellulophaga]ADV47618.1 hypothetical protein Celal_0272 [Cellulophaga algicola DSM 14237]MBO0589979.1 hypothetical protein [Cellulophaga sp. E16_2]
MNTLIIIITGIVGTILTFYLSEHLKQGPVRASALLALIVALFFQLFPEVFNPYLTKHIPIVFIGASFIGMISSEAKGSYSILVIASILFSVIYINKSPFFNGYGGALGASAFIALLTTMGISVIFSKNRKIVKRVILRRKKVQIQKKHNKNDLNTRV